MEIYQELGAVAFAQFQIVDKELQEIKKEIKELRRLITEMSNHEITTIEKEFDKDTTKLKKIIRGL